jgi:hypothetical protein
MGRRLASAARQPPLIYGLAIQLATYRLAGLSTSRRIDLPICRPGGFPAAGPLPAASRPAAGQPARGAAAAGFPAGPCGGPAGRELESLVMALETRW